jgi:hypothetical protein
MCKNFEIALQLDAFCCIRTPRKEPVRVPAAGDPSRQ